MTKFSNKFNFLHSSGASDSMESNNGQRRFFPAHAEPTSVKTLAVGKDRYAGLRSQAYINARQAENKAVQTSAHLPKKEATHE